MARSEARLIVRLSLADKQTIQRRAKAHGLTVSDFVRTKCLKESNGPVIETDPELLTKLYRDLRRAGGLCNQLARHANTRRQDLPSLATQAEEALRDVSKASSDVSKFIQDARNSI